MSMTVSQELNNIYDQSYDDDITVTDVPKGYFLAVTAITLPEEASTREITVNIYPLEQAEGGTQKINSSLYSRQENETAVKVSVMQDGNLMAENTTNY